MPPDVAAALQTGQWERHEASSYGPASNTINSMLFLVPGGTAIPAPQPAPDDPFLIGASTMLVNWIYWNSYSAGVTAAMIGRVSATPDRFKSYLPLGSTFVLSFEIPSGTPGQVACVVGVFPGVITFALLAATGSIAININSNCSSAQN